MAPGRVLVETPAYMVDTWNAEMLTNPKSGVGISGTHTALLAVAERFAASGWETYLLGAVSQPSTAAAARGVHYVPKSDVTTRLKDMLFNLTIVATALGQLYFDTVATRRLCILMEMQDFSPTDAERLQRYSVAQRAADPSYELVFAHLSPWGQSLFPRYAPTWMQQSQWIKHLQWRNPIDVKTIECVRVSSRIHRLPLGFIFPACLERGGAVAARVYARMRDDKVSRMIRRPRAEARATWAAYAKANRLSEAEQVGIHHAAGRASDVRMMRLSKEALARELLSSSFFVYGLASVGGVVHYDTFANAVGEALAAGVLVLAPPIAALPSVFGDAITWVTPTGGIPAVAKAAYKPLKVMQLHDDAMIGRYVEAIKQLQANTTRRVQMRRLARRLVLSYSAENVTSNLFEMLTRCAAKAARTECEEYYQRYPLANLRGSLNSLESRGRRRHNARKGGRVLAMVFAGRQQLMAMLMRNLVRELSTRTLTHVHLWDFCKLDSDSSYLRKLKAQNSRVAVKQGGYRCNQKDGCHSSCMPKTKCRPDWKVAYSFYATKEHLADDDILVKIDDDVPYIHNLYALIREAGSANGFVYPSIVNNDVLFHWQLHDKIITPTASDLKVPSIRYVWERRAYDDFKRTGVQGLPYTGKVKAGDDPACHQRTDCSKTSGSGAWYQDYRTALITIRAFLDKPDRFAVNVTHVWHQNTRVSVNMLAGRGAHVRKVYSELTKYDKFPLPDEPLMSHLTQDANVQTQ